MTRIKQLLRNIYVYACRMSFGVEKKAVFTSFSGKSYSDNPKAISEVLHAIAPEIKIVWFFKAGYRNLDLPDYITAVDNTHVFEVHKHLATAAAVVNNCGMAYIPKNEKQIFIQTWHGDKGFKKILHDAAYRKDEEILNEEIPGYCDYAIAGSEYGIYQYRSAFRYTGRILMEGTPRNDRLINPDEKWCAAKKEQLSIPAKTKVLLYAPTLRRESAARKQAQPIRDLDIVRTLDALEQKDGCAWKCLLRAHPTIVGLSGIREDDRILDMSAYEDMADLLLISDMLITDYSSCAGDFALLHRPIVLFHADKQEYLEKDRTLYFDIEDSPYIVAENQEELEEIIVSLTLEKAERNCNEILKFYGDFETGHATLSVAQIIKECIGR